MHQVGRGMHGSRRLRAGLAGASALTAIVGLSYVTPSAAAARLAPAPDRAARGGAVIVMLKTQHSGMDERTQARALKAATESNQASIVAAIKAAGGTNVLQLTEPNAVAATLSASAVASLRANPKVALSSPL